VDDAAGRIELEDLLARGGAFAELITAQTIGTDFIKAEIPSPLPPPTALPPTYSS
jgi:hypothetical protein